MFVAGVILIYIGGLSQMTSSIKKWGLAMPHKKIGCTPVVLSAKEVAQLLKLLGYTTKKALAFQAIAQKQGIRTDEVRLFANCSNVPNAAIDANKKLMNYGLMLICDKPAHKAYNSGFHFWYLVEAPIQQVPVAMAMNDSRV